MAAIGLLGLVAVTPMGCFLDMDPPPEPVSNWTGEDARGFDELPLYWRGESYEELALTSMRLSTDGEGFRHASFFYGEPSLAGGAPSQSWLPPLEVDMQPYCGYSPEEFLGHERYVDSDISSVQIRGVDGYLERYSSSEATLVLWAGGSEVLLRTWKTDLDIEQAARNLIPIADELGAPLNPLSPPTTTSC